MNRRRLSVVKVNVHRKFPAPATPSWQIRLVRGLGQPAGSIGSKFSAVWWDGLPGLGRGSQLAGCKKSRLFTCYLFHWAVPECIYSSNVIWRTCLHMFSPFTKCYTLVWTYWC